ncbi:MAG TPA: CHASE domain-containing protein [Rariglobus sp.]|nr:CHASE domain-containing protein [Rariglobus sp.]
MSQPTPPPRNPAALCRLYAPVVATLVAGLAFSIALFLTIRSWERRETQAAVLAAASQRVELLRESLGNSLEALHSLRSFFEAQGADRVDYGHFQQFVRGILARHPELQALSWTPRVPAAQRTAFESQARDEGLNGFEFTELDPATDHMVPARIRQDYYYPVYFIEPLDRNQAALGYDLNGRITTLIKARDTGDAVSTPPIQLVQEERHEPGFIVYLPLFSSATANTVEARRKENIGFVAAVFRVADLVNPALAGLQDLRVHVSDVAAGSALGYDVPHNDSQPDSTDLAPCVLPLSFAGRDWLLTFTPSEHFDGGRRPWQSWTVLVGGLLLTSLLAGYILGDLRRDTEVARANAALQVEVVERKRAEESAAAANRAKSDFLASLSHEIRTPLNSILGYAQIIGRDPDLPRRHHDAVGALANSGQHLLGLLNAILDLSKIEAGRMDVQREVFDLHALVHGIAEMFKPACAEKNLTLRVGLVGDGAQPVVGDEGKLRQVLINLIGNAIKFTPRGEILVGLGTAGDDLWRFEVIDTGIGLSPDERAGLFAPFHQTTIGRRYGGTGLGLAIARRQVELMGGMIEVQSEPGVGSRFQFTLPLPASVVPASITLGPLPKLAAGVTVRALVVDDNRDNRILLTRLLADLGCRVASAANASSARDIALCAPDILFIDVLLGETTGPALVATLRTDGLPDTVPVIYHTAALLNHQDHDAIRADGGTLLAKPFRLEDLCTCLLRVPGARFEEIPGTPAPPPLELDRIVLPQELCTRMTVAAELHSTTVLKACLDDLRALGGPAVPFADHLRHLLRAYDLASIARLLTRVQVESPAETKNPVLTS